LLLVALGDVEVAERDHELRDARGGVDLDVDPLDARAALVVGVDVLEVERTAELEELEVRADHDLAGGRVADAGLHRRAEPVDVQAHARAALDLGGLGVRLVLLGLGLLVDGLLSRESTQRREALCVDLGEPHAEVTSAGFLVAPRDLAGHDDFLAVDLEAAGQGLADLRQIGSAEVHSGRVDVHGLRFKRGRAAFTRTDFDDRLDRGTPASGLTTFLFRAHT